MKRHSDYGIGRLDQILTHSTGDRRKPLAQKETSRI
jgi:hypothetical protein